MTGLTVYIDVLIVLNIYISYFCLRAVSVLLHTKLTSARLSGAAVFGGFSSLAALIGADILVSVVLRIALTVAMVLIAFGFSSPGKLAFRCALCFTVGMLICGASELIHDLTGSSLIFTANGYVYMSVSAFVLVIASTVIYGVLSLLRRFLDSPAADKPVMLTITNSGRKAVICAFPDSGSNIRDFLTGKPVVICKRSAVENIVPSNVRSYLGGKTDDLTGIRLIPVSTVAGSGVAAAFRPDCMSADIGGTEKLIDALIGINGDALENEEFDALISPKLLR